MISQPASTIACTTRGRVSQTRAFKETVGRMPAFSKAARMRQMPTRMPYSCQVQLGTSGTGATPPGGGETMRGMARAMSHSSILTTGQTTMRAPPGSLSGGRSTMAENGRRSFGRRARASSSDGLGTLIEYPQEWQRQSRGACRSRCGWSAPVARASCPPATRA